MPNGVVSGRPFAKGNPGRPRGSKNRRQLEIRTFALSLMTDPEYVQMLRLRMKAGKAPHMEIFFAQHAWGKPKERIEITANDPTILRLFVVEERDAISYGNGSNGHNGNGHGDEPPVIDITPEKPDDDGS